MNFKKVVFLALIYFVSLFVVLKATTYFHVEAAYNGIIAEQYNYRILAELLAESKIEEAQNYLDELQLTNKNLLKAALDDEQISSEINKKIVVLLDKEMGSE